MENYLREFKKGMKANWIGTFFKVKRIRDRIETKNKQKRKHNEE
jgi:hypothetical protein